MTEASRIRVNNLVAKHQAFPTPWTLGGVAVTADGGELNTLDSITATVSELNIMHGVTATAAELSKLASATPTTTEINKLAGITGYPMQSAEVTFTETSGAGVYTGSVTIPAGATLHDIIINGVALWNSQTSATLKVGDAGVDDGYYTAVNLLATDLLAGESLSFSMAGGKAGGYIANSQVSPRYSASQRVISGIITKVGTSGTLGRTRMLVIWSLPGAQTAATKV